jgi:hypothetical protein
MKKKSKSTPSGGRAIGRAIGMKASRVGRTVPHHATAAGPKAEQKKAAEPRASRTLRHREAAS